MASVMHFDVPDGELPFTIGSQSFVAFGALPADDFPAFIEIVSRLGEDVEAESKVAEARETVRMQIDVTMEALAMACPPDTVERIRTGISHNAEHRIPFPILVKILNWLMVQYKMAEGAEDEGEGEGESPPGVERPTPPTPDSPAT